MSSLRLRNRSNLLFSQILESASRGTLANWGRRQPLIETAPRAGSRFETKLRDSQVVAEFRGKLRQAEDLIAKLGYSLREITQQRD
jgi:hypothetical protein